MAESAKDPNYLYGGFGMNALTKNNKRTKIPNYKKDGSVHSFWKTVLVTIGIIFILIGLAILSIHVPAILYKPVEEKKAAVPYAIRPDETGIRNLNEYIKDHPDDDFDNDGLKNKDEQNHKTDARNPDSDLDGISDYAEIHVYNTRPNEKDNQLELIVGKILEQNKTSYKTPYKLHDVIMWADDLASRSAGTVIPTIRGYRFSKFDGWAQFPGKVYAYLIEDGFHVPLEYRQAENAWRIESKEGDIQVVLYSAPLETTHLLEFFGRKYYVEDSLISDIFDIVLPEEHSFINYKQIVKQDTYDIEINATVTEPVMPEVDKKDLTRFGKNTTELTDLTKVYTSIMSGKPVAVSLQSPNYGEVVCMVYGYTDYGDLLIADEFGNKTDKNQSQMMITITERSAITVDQNGNLWQREYFDFEGLGFNSDKGDKICFIFQDQ